jgi:hypothetical protein
VSGVALAMKCLAIFVPGIAREVNNLSFVDKRIYSLFTHPELRKLYFLTEKYR